jgi:hypothetical protein
MIVAAEKSLDYRLSHGGGQTGWRRTWRINFARNKQEKSITFTQGISEIVGAAFITRSLCPGKNWKRPSHMCVSTTWTYTAPGISRGSTHVYTIFTTRMATCWSSGPPITHSTNSPLTTPPVGSYQVARIGPGHRLREYRS